MSSALDRVREVAKRDKEVKFTALLHHVTEERLAEAFRTTKRSAAPGVDGITWHDYEAAGPEDQLRDLHGRVHRGAYRAKPVRRVHIAKGDGKVRRLGITSLEDKIVQRAVVTVLNAIYEEDFLGFSYGYRPGQKQHDALDALAECINGKKVNWVLDADIRGFFDAISHEWMIKFIEHRVVDKRILRLIKKWLKAGVLESGIEKTEEQGTPQGATISPLLANIYLHYVFDLWVHKWRREHRGDIVVVRYADDFVVGFQYETEAKLFVEDLRNRLAKFSLELHPDKTQLIEFGRFAAKDREKRGQGKPKTFTFLGFRHICGTSRNGKFTLRRHTIRSRMAAKLKEIKEKLMRRRHDSIAEQGAWLRSVVNGYFNYYAVPNNTRALQMFRKQVCRHWLFALRRRSQKHRLTWERMSKVIERWLPIATIRHPWPGQRFLVKTQGRSPVR